jgi:hypothetical protein
MLNSYTFKKESKSDMDIGYFEYILVPIAIWKNYNGVLLTELVWEGLKTRSMIR